MRQGRSRGTGGGETDLNTSARSGDLTMVKSILSSNPLALNNRDKHSRTPLHLAAWAGQTEVVSYLCEHKADVGAAAMDDMGAIHFAAQKGHLEVVRTLLSSGVSTKSSTQKGPTPLHYAAQVSYLNLVKYLVKKCASLTAKTKAGKTPADLASSEEIRSFLEKSAQLAADGARMEKVKLKNPVQQPNRMINLLAPVVNLLHQITKNRWRMKLVKGKASKMPQRKLRRNQKEHELHLNIF